MKRSLLHRTARGIRKLFRPMHKLRTRINKGLTVQTVRGHALTTIDTGTSIEVSIACRGRKRSFPRFSRSKYNPLVEDAIHGIA